MSIKNNYFYKLKEKFRIKKIDSEQPIATWIFVITLNIIAFIGFFLLRSYDVNLSN